MFIGKYNKSVILTYIGACLSILGITLAINQHLSYAVICLIFSGVCDLFDGVIARRCKRNEEEKAFGVQIDSLTDMLSFIALPCVIGTYLMSGIGYFAYPICAFYALCGIIRLAWFNITTNPNSGRKYYEGLPVTYSALIIPIFYLLNNFISTFYLALVFAIIYIITALLFILKVKIIKPKGIWYIIFGLLSILITVLILVVGV